ncbi:MAG: formate dehydrogenase accessory protein FdhE [Desulfohalobiaceae bacterium]
MRTEQRKEAIEGVLQELKKQNDLPDQLVQLVQDIVFLHSQALDQNKSPLPAQEDLAEPSKHSQGLPLLPRQHFPYDKNQAEDLFFQAMQILGNDAQHLHSALERLQNMLSAKNIVQLEVFQAYLQDSQKAFQLWAVEFPEAPGLLRFLAHSSLSPSLFNISEYLLQFHDQDKIWEFGYCPICGSLPLICYLHKQGQRYGCCSFCGAQYHLPRLGCVFCGDQEAGRHDYLYAQEIPGFKLDVCQSCGNYIKTADFREMDRHYHPALDDLQSLALDLAAQEKGYARPTFSAWGF